MDNTEEAYPVAPTAGAAHKCASCGVSLFQADERRTPLCETCREHFIKYPFPVWVKIFGGAVLLLLLVALSSLPRSIGVGIHYKRGQVAEEKHNYFTAQKELETVVRKEPSFIDARCRLMIAAFYNTDFTAMGAAYKDLEGKKIEDNALYKEVNQVMDASNIYFPTDSFSSFVKRYSVPKTDIPVADYYKYLDSNTHDAYACLHIANLLYDQEKYTECDSLLNEALGNDRHYLSALALKMPLKQEMGELDSSIFYSNRILDINHEYTYAYASRVKALLKQKKDAEALQWAKKGMAIDDKDPYMQGCMALAYHFNNDAKNRDAILSKAPPDSITLTVMAGIKDIVSGKEKFRD